MDEEAALREARRKEREEQHLYLTARVVTEDTYRAHSGTDLATFESPDKDPGAARSYRVLRNSTIQDLASRVGQDIGHDPRVLRFWYMVNRQNRTIRPDQPLLDVNQTLEQSHQKLVGAKSQEIRLWVEVAEDIDEKGEPIWHGFSYVNGALVKSDSILLFLKWFDVDNQVLRGIGHVYIGKDRRVEELVPLILKKMGWPEKSSTDDSTQLKLYEVSLPLWHFSLSNAWYRKSSLRWWIL